MRSIRAKIIMLLLCCVILSSAAVSYICFRQMSASIKDTTTENMLLLCEKNARTLNMTFESIETAVETLAHYTTENLPSTDLLHHVSSSAYTDYITNVSRVALNHASALHSPASVYVVFNPEIYTQAPGLFYVYEEGDPVAKSISDITTVTQTGTDWWSTPLQAGRATWIDGDYSSDASNTERYFSYVVPMYSADGHVLGVAGMDFSYTLLHSLVADIRVMNNGYANILDRSKHVIAHPTITEGALVGENYQDQAYAEIKNQFLDSQSAAFETGEYDFDKALVRQLFTYEQNGQLRAMTLCVLQNGMTLCLSASQDEIYAEQHSMILQTVLIILLTASFSIAMAIVFANHLTAPLVALNKAARQFANGDLESTVAVTSRDEIGDLTRILEDTRVRLRDSLDELYREAHIDTLTGTHNKTAFTDIQAALSTQIEAGEAEFALILFDVNYLKIINDTFGHIAGDELLQKIATCIKAVFGSQNVYRLGGDEFAALLYTKIDSEGGERAAECMAMIADQKLENYPDVPISCAVGVAFCNTSDRSFYDVFARADQAMYQHKTVIKKETPFWHKDLQSMRQVQIQHYLEFLDILGHSMDAYPFLFDITANKNWFFNNAEGKYPVCPTSSRTNTIEDMMNAVHPDDREALSADLKKIADGTKSEHNMNYRWITHDGKVVWINCHGKVIYDNDGKPFLMIGRVSDTVLLPWYNPLTTLFNKTKFSLDFSSGTLSSFSHFMLINIDNLSHINIKYGLSYGDRMLQMLAEVLIKLFPGEMLYHMEKDYFALLLTAQKESKIRTMIRQIQQQVEEFITISVAVVPNETRFHMDANSLYEHTRHLLKSSKSESGNTVAFFTSEDFTHTLSDLDLVEELDDSVYKNNFKNYHLCFQPQVDARTYEVVACEALLRYTSPTKGNIPPSTFIPILERTHLILEVGLWVLKNAIKQCVEWRKTCPDLRISVNISSVQLKNDDLANEILGLLNKSALPADALKLEITETTELIGSSFLHNFTKLRTAGVHISIDDFGTGYANLAYLQKIHADELKIDRVFIQNLKQGTFHYTLINNIATFAKKNSLRLCMEGIETVSELATVELTGPDLLQGYLFDKPLTAAEFEARYVAPQAPTEWDFSDALKKEHDRIHFTYFDAQDLLSKVKVGLWSILLDKKEQTGKLYCDDVTRELLSIGNIQRSSACFKYVMNHISAHDLDRVAQRFTTMARTGEVTQVEYNWMHPKKGMIKMRCTGKLVNDQNGIMTFEGFLHAVDG